MSFYGLASFYYEFICSFSTIMTTINNCLKHNILTWTKKVVEAFMANKEQIAYAHILQLLDFYKVLEVACDTSNIDICSVLS